MIRLPATSFGYGLRVGVTRVLRERARLSPLGERQGCVLVLPFLPSIPEFTGVAMTPGVEFFIIPLCSSYSHLTTTIWTSVAPTMAIQQPWRLLDGVSVLADFDNGLLLVAESESEAEEFQKQVRESATARQTRDSESSTISGVRSTVAVLAEATSASDVLRALADGADGLSVVKAEQLFRE